MSYSEEKLVTVLKIGFTAAVSARATLIHSAVQPVAVGDTHQTTAITAFMIEFEYIIPP